LRNKPIIYHICNIIYLPVDSHAASTGYGISLPGWLTVVGGMRSPECPSQYYQSYILFTSSPSPTPI